MDDDDISEGFFDNLQPLNTHFNEATSGKEASGHLMQELSEVEARYDDSEELDRGGMKCIISSTDKMTFRQVAKAKLLNQVAANSEKFIREARLTASLEHPNIIPIYDLGVDEAEPFFTMKMVEGENLSDLIKKLRDNPQIVSRQDLMQIFLKICDAVAYAHSKKVIHLDLKPANIRLGHFGEVIVCDWGLAKIIGDDTDSDTVSLDPNIYNDVTLDGMIKGSPGYLAPEQASKNFGCKDERTDIYALGGILYSLLVFRPPVKTKDIQESLNDTIAGNIVHPLKIDSKQSLSLAAVAMKALSTEKGDRYGSVVELRAEINKWLSGFATGAEAAGFFKSLWLLMKRHKGICILIFLTACLSSFLILKVIVNEREALAARDMYLNEKEHGRQEGLKDSSRLYDLSWKFTREYDFDNALKNIDLAIEKNPSNSSFWDWKARLHLIRQEFNAACRAYRHKKVDKDVRKDRMWELCEKYSKIKSLDNELLSVAELGPFFDQLAHVQFTYLACGYGDQKAKDLQYRIDLAMLFMKKISNRNVKDWSFDIGVVGENVEIDFSHIKGFYSVAGIRFLPVIKLNLAYTNLSITQDLEELPLEELNITGTKILDPRPLFRIKTLKKLIFGKGQYKGVRFPKRIEIERIGTSVKE
jgi:serine/threonine protein kinase